MNAFIKEHVYLIISIAFLLGGTITTNIYNAMHNVDNAICKNAIVEEKILLTQEVSEGVTEEVTQYLVRCVGVRSHSFRIQTGRDYPLNSHINKTWVYDGEQ